MPDMLETLRQGLDALKAWQRAWPDPEPAAELAVPDDALARAIHELADRLQDNYPFFHPQYAGQMLKPPHPVAAIAYAMTMMTVNPNNHALDGGAATAKMEREAIEQLARMFGYGAHLGHLTSSGTIANLEALWVARSLHPGKAIAYSSQAHYTHSRMCEVLGVRGVAIDVDDRGRLSVASLLAVLEAEDIGTVVATAGTTGLGAIDPIDELVLLGKEHGFRVHVDAAYGGFYRLLADLASPMVDAAPFLAIAESDSVVLDPHKHGLQPYGCGSVLFRDPSVGRFYQHDSPYTYFTSKELHLGEISLECSRAGAAAAAFWTTLRCFPLSGIEGFGPILQATRRAALTWAEMIKASDGLELVIEPQLDIVAFFSTQGGWSASAISRQTERIFDTLMNRGAQSVYLAKFVVPKALLAERHPGILWDADHVTVLRSVLMKPEHEALVPWLHEQVLGVAAG